MINNFQNCIFSRSTSENKFLSLKSKDSLFFLTLFKLKEICFLLDHISYIIKSRIRRIFQIPLIIALISKSHFYRFPRVFIEKSPLHTKNILNSRFTIPINTGKCVNVAENFFFFFWRGEYRHVVAECKTNFLPLLYARKNNIP